MPNPLYRNDKPGTYPDSWYAASCTPAPQRPVLQSDVRADVCVVGGGYTGLTAALTLAQKGMNVVLLEAHRAGFGASGRNGGQVGSGFNKDQQWMDKKMGKPAARRLWDMSNDAKKLVRDQVAAHAPDARYTPGVASGEWTAKGADAARRYGDWLRQTYGYETEFLDRDAFQAICRGPVYQGGLLDMDAGHIHPLRYALGLARACEAAGVRIFERSEVHYIEDGTPSVLRTGSGRVKADHVILAGNGYLPNIAPQVTARVMPINSFIAATAPLGKRAADVLTRDIAVADDKFVVNYFRLSEDNRLLFGGRESYSIGFPRDIGSALCKRMLHLFPQLSDVKLDYVWGGTLGITMSRLPAIQRVAPNMLSAAGFSGHGVALSGFAGKVMAEAIAGQADRFDLLSTLPTPRFPGGGAFRAPMLTLAMTWYSMRDKLGI